MKTTINSNLNTQNQTMYNLHTKRTLPRDVIKWMQGLDLSYSVKDYRKDMSNGFLIAEIISRYQPGRIPMHAFQNSHNQARKDNNWGQLEFFFSKNTLRTIQISSDQYSKIKANNDPKSEHLYNFICRLYSICTKRTIPQNAPVLDLPPTQNNNPNLTTSYLLRDDGLQKLQNSGIQSNNASHLQNSGFIEKNQDRVPTRKIAPHIETGDQVDATGVGIKAEGRKMTSKRKSWNFQQRQQSNQELQNAEADRLIFDYLNSIMQECLPTQDPTIRELIFPDDSKFTPTEILARSIQSIDQQYFKQVITQLNLSVEDLAPIILRQINQTWKFFTYFFKFLRTLNEQTAEFHLVCELLSNYASHCHEKEAKRLSKVFYDSLLGSIINQVKLAPSLRKKQKIMELVYDFSGRQLEQKKNVLSRLKDQIGSSNVLYIQWLSVLVKQQIKKDKLDSKLLDDYIYYALQYISSPSIVSKTSALKILTEISKFNCASIEKYFVSKCHVFRNGRGDPQQVYLFIQIYFNILRDLVESKEYQSLVKGVGSNNLVKAYNPDNQKNAEQLKSRVNLISQTIKQLSQGSANSSVRQICAKKSVSFIQQSKQMMLIFLDYIYTSQNKEQFFNSENVQHEFKSVNVVSTKVSVASIKDYSNEILIEIIALKINNGYSIEELMSLINLCLENLNIKKINMEFWEDVSLHIVKSYTKLIGQAEYTKSAVEGIIKVFSIYFNYDMKIRELSQWIAESINGFTEFWGNSSGNNKQHILYVSDSIKHLNQWLNQEYLKNKNQMISFIINQISQNLTDHKDIHNKTQKLIFLKH